MAKENTMIIGDRLMTDIQTGINAGIMPVLTLTGETRVEDIKASRIKPDFIVSSMEELCDLI